MFLLFHSLQFELRTVSLCSKHYQPVNPMNPLLLEHVGESTAGRYVCAVGVVPKDMEVGSGMPLLRCT